MIDEDKLIKELKFQINNCETYGHSDIYIDLEMAKKWVETIEKKKVGEWIPCSERLPEIAGVYRVTCLYADKVYRVKDDLFYSDRTWGYDNPNRNRKVIAWKPLEKQYEVKENG